MPLIESTQKPKPIKINNEQLEKINQEFLDGYRQIIEAFNLDSSLIDSFVYSSDFWFPSNITPIEIELANFKHKVKLTGLFNHPLTGYRKSQKGKWQLSIYNDQEFLVYGISVSGDSPLEAIKKIASAQPPIR